jgi:hypothetical protein
MFDEEEKTKFVSEHPFEVWKGSDNMLEFKGRFSNLDCAVRTAFAIGARVEGPIENLSETEVRNRWVVISNRRMG